HRSSLEQDMDLPTLPYSSGRLLGGKFSLVHALDTRIPKKYSGPLVVNVFDILSALPMSATLHLSPKEFRKKKLHRYEEIARRAQVIVPLSSKVREEFLERFPTRARCVTIPPGVAPIASRGREESVQMLSQHGIAPPFVLSVGALCPRKNVE